MHRTSPADGEIVVHKNRVSAHLVLAGIFPRRGQVTTVSAWAPALTGNGTMAG